jgi:hypothetical protein
VAISLRVPRHEQGTEEAGGRSSDCNRLVVVAEGLMKAKKWMGSRGAGRKNKVGSVVHLKTPVPGHSGVCAIGQKNERKAWRLGVEM